MSLEYSEDDVDASSTILSRKAMNKRKTIFTTLVHDFEDHRNKKLDCVEDWVYLDKEFKTISSTNLGSSSQESNIIQAALDTELFSFTKKAIDHQSKLIEALVIILTNKEYQFKEENACLSMIERCGSVLYTATYEYMLEKNSLARKRNTTSNSVAQKTLKRDLRRVALTETLNALSILESCFRYVLSSTATKVLGRFAYFFPDQPMAIKLTSLLETSPTLVDQIADCVSERNIALVNANGNIRKVLKPTNNKRKNNSKLLKKLKKKKQSDKVCVTNHMRNFSI
jgi:hypothetical protein